MPDKRDGKIYFGERDFEFCHPSEDHPLEFMATKLEGYDAEHFYEEYMMNKMICTYKTGVLHGLIEVFNDMGFLILSGKFEKGYAEGKWKIFYEGADVDDFFESEWKKGRLISPHFYDAGDFEYVKYVNGPPAFTKNADGETWNISHEIWGYWSNFSDPQPTFNVTYQVKGKHLIQRKIIQHPFWGEKETEISVESFDENGALSAVKLHGLIEKHNAYQEPLRFKDWSGYDDDNSAEVLMVRTIDLLEAREVEGKYELEFEGIYDTSFGYGLKLNTSTQTLKEMRYFAWGNPYGVSINFGTDNKINKLKWEGETVIWDIENGLNDNFLKQGRKNIKDMMRNGEPPFGTK